jgi:hypothetical protein
MIPINSYYLNAQVINKAVIKRRHYDIGRYALGLALLGLGISILKTWCLWITKHLLDWLLLEEASDSDGSYMSCQCINFNAASL